jgi:hypothetical protein
LRYAANILRLVGRVLCEEDEAGFFMLTSMSEPDPE